MPNPRKTVGYLLKKSNLSALVRKLTQVLTVYGPVATKSQFKFDRIENGEPLRLDYDTTILPPKKYFFPPKQEMLTFSRSPKLEINDALSSDSGQHDWNGKNFLVFGVHSCDLAAISFHDDILTQIYPDPYRAKRREEGIILGLNCMTPCEDSFCLSAGALNSTDCADIMITPLEDAYFFEVLTEVGVKLIDYTQEFFTKAKSKQVTEINRGLKERETQFPNPLHDFNKLPSQLDATYEGEMWIRYGRRCFGCGSCTMVCPTCFCFDVYDEVDLNLNDGARVRTWDSCQLVDFALVAGGHNFRPTVPSRVRFRIYHKFRAEPDQINQIGCVGCGRCTRTCPADIDMIELLADIKKGGK
ncbi:MAG: 4Fe-4S dicluster domain-containing protein [Candidatus Hermodarchaeia archaeon]|jgi:formate hydrogenlyase subunit 6/NADH:ubiquinone oxidoreductase subunit I